MGEPAQKYRRGLSLAGKVGAFGGALLFVLYSGPFFQRHFDRLHDWWWKGYDQFPSGSAVHRVIDLLGHGFMGLFAPAVATVVGASLFLVPLGLLGRWIARARVKAGGADPIAPAQQWTLAHPGWVRALTAVLPAAWSMWAASDLVGTWRLDWSSGYEALGLNASFGIVGVFATIALTAFARAGLRALVAPLGDEIDRAQPAAVTKDEIAFDAVAVTGETRAAVVAMTAMSVGAVALALFSRRVFHDPAVVAWLGAYVAVALGGAALFRHASKVAVGVDGVLVKGTSRTRFYAYRDLDAARVDGSDLELVRKDSVVLRLQLHSDDASKRAAVLARIRDAIDCVKEGRGAVSAQLVSSATPQELARAASGGATYRGAALTREQLWALVEGPEVDEGARRAAAEALAATSGAADRARLRVAAEHCAAPSVRVALERLAEGEAPDEDADASGARGAAMRHSA